ncbi:MAG: hypothetical protein ACTSRP_08390 [Candidatus Helarchaeota archaeon]
MKINKDDFQDCQKKLFKLEIFKWLKKEKSNAKVMRQILYENTEKIEDIDQIWDKFKFFIENR